MLRILKGKYPEQMCVRDVASRMIEKNSNVPMIIDRLELKKLVNRSTSTADKRETVITLTPEGIVVLDKCNVRVNVLFDELLAINNEEATVLNELLEKVRSYEG